MYLSFIKIKHYNPNYYHYYPKSEIICMEQSHCNTVMFSNCSSLKLSYHTLTYITRLKRHSDETTDTYFKTTD